IRPASVHPPVSPSALRDRRLLRQLPRKRRTRGFIHLFRTLVGLWQVRLTRPTSTAHLAGTGTPAANWRSRPRTLPEAERAFARRPAPPPAGPHEHRPPPHRSSKAAPRERAVRDRSGATTAERCDAHLAPTRSNRLARRRVALELHRSLLNHSSREQPRIRALPAVLFLRGLRSPVLAAHERARCS